MAQGKVTDFFSARKRSSALQPSKRRKIEITSSEVDISSLTKTNTDPVKNQVQEPVSVDKRKENVFSPLQTRAGRKAKGVKPPSQHTTTRSRKAKTDPKQKLLPDILASSSVLVDQSGTQIAEAVTSSWDEHDGTPTKSAEGGKVTTQGNKRGREVAVTQPGYESTPEKRRSELAKSTQDPRARKRLLLKPTSAAEKVNSCFQHVCIKFVIGCCCNSSMYINWIQISKCGYMLCMLHLLQGDWSPFIIYQNPGHFSQFLG